MGKGGPGPLEVIKAGISNPLQALAVTHDPAGLFYKAKDKTLLEYQAAANLTGIGAKAKIADDKMAKGREKAWAQDASDTIKAKKQLKKEEQMATSLLASANNSMQNVKNREQIKKLGN